MFGFVPCVPCLALPVCRLSAACLPPARRLGAARLLQQSIASSNVTVDMVLRAKAELDRGAGGAAGWLAEAGRWRGEIERRAVIVTKVKKVFSGAGTSSADELEEAQRILV